MLNKVQFIGHLGRDPDVNYLPSGAAVCNFSVAASEKWKDKNSGEQMERTEWLRCTAFERLAEVCGEYLKKGSLVYVEGSLQTRKWQDKDGVDRFTTECRVGSMKMLGGRQGRDGGEERQRPAAAPAAKPAARPSGGVPGRKSEPSGFDDMDDDIPF